MGEQHGPKAAVGAALAEVGAALKAAEPEQLDLLPPTRFEPGTPEHDRLRAAVARERGGRPQGAQNKATTEVKEFCRRVFGFDPLVRGFQRVMHTPETLASELGCSKLEAYDRLTDLEKDLRRYFYAPMLPVDADGKPLPFFQMIVGGQHAHLAPGEGGVPWLDPATGQPWGAPLEGDFHPVAAPAETQQNQALSADPLGVSHVDQSHEDE